MNNKESVDELIEERLRQKVKKAHRTVKVSGRSVIRLRRLIIERSQKTTRRRAGGE